VFELTSYLGLFVVAFGAATLLPLQSEAVLIGMLVSGSYSTAWLLVVATAGNVLGSVANWWVGRSIERFRNKHWFPISPRHLDKAQNTYRRFGHWSLVLCWVPIIGDPITIVAGVMRESLWRFLLIVTLVKTTRYLVIMLMTLGWVT
jgi:membrane protein YqaA with SNARE-associated domain